MKSGREVVDLALLILALVLPSVISDVTCPSEFVAHENSCYRISPAIERIKWNAARTACNNLDGYLAEVTSQSENDFLVAQIRGADRHFWIGGSDADVEGQWVWTNSGSLIGYTNWSPGNPNNGGSVEHCLTYSVNNFMWNDLKCEGKQRFICEYGPLPTTTEPPTQPPTESPTQPSTEPSTEPPTEPSTEPSTQPPTEPPTQPPTEPPTQPPTEPPTQPSTEPSTEPPMELSLETRIAAFVYECHPNGSIVVDNPNINQFQTSFANCTSAVCTSTYNDDFTKLTITGCPLNEDILLVFTYRTEDFDPIIGGHEVEGYIIQCSDIGTGVSRAFTLGFSTTISAAPVLPITPQLTITSALRNGFPFGEMAVTSAVLTTRLYWTIDVPAPYYSNPTVCTVYSGTSVSTSALSRIVISDACSQDQDLVGNFGNFLEDSVSRRNWALFHVFKFYDSDYITISCVIQLCRIDVDCTPSCTDRRRRSASEDPIEQMLTMTTLKVLNDKVLSNASIMGTDEERGLLKWREDAGAVVGDSDELANVYTIPRLQKYFNNLRISKYLPFCPNFNPTSGESQKHSDDAPQKIDTAFNNPCVVQHGDSVVTRL